MKPGDRFKFVLTHSKRTITLEFELIDMFGDYEFKILEDGRDIASSGSFREEDLKYLIPIEIWNSPLYTELK